ncbi:MAG: hypothetical protein ACREHG_09505 [Candidatus Saccharimonadales bacterium]
MLKKTHGKILLHKLIDVKHETLLELKQRVKEGYIKAMEKRLTTSGTTGQAAYAMYLLAWSVVMRIEFANPNVIEHMTKYIR